MKILFKLKREVWAWALYDWANSAFATTVMAGFFPLFFKAFWADPADPAHSTLALGWANSASSILIAAAAPILGAVADRGAAKKNFLLGFTALGVASTAALWFVGQGQWAAAASLYVAGTIGFMGANSFYDALLTSLADDSRIDFVSALGYAMGYIGGGLLFAANVLMFLKPSSFGIADPSTAIRLSFLGAAAWWALFSLPLAGWVAEPEVKDPVPMKEAAAAGWKQFKATFAEVRRLRVVGTFLLAYWLYIDGVDTIVRMAVDYGMSVGFKPSALITALLLVQFVAFPAALAYGWLAGKIGAKRALLWAIGAYSVITVGAYFMKTEIHFYLMAAAVGLFQGGIQALSRSLYAQIIPPDKSAEFFGFYNMLGKFAAVIGPALMGSITALTGDPRMGMLSLLILFAGGGGLLAAADIEAGKLARFK